jgi:VanZ family protein
MAPFVGQAADSSVPCRATRSMPRSLRVPLLWLAVVLFMGNGHFGAVQTGAWLIPLLKPLMPWATPRDVHALHMVLRKLGHLTEYAILARVWMHGVLLCRAASVRTAAWVALLICIACAFVDEAHQSMLLTRTGSVADALLDCLGALLMLMLLRARYDQRPMAYRAPAVT